MCIVPAPISDLTLSPVRESDSSPSLGTQFTVSQPINAQEWPHFGVTLWPDGKATCSCAASATILCQHIHATLSHCFAQHGLHPQQHWKLRATTIRADRVHPNAFTDVDMGGGFFDDEVEEQSAGRNADHYHSSALQLADAAMRKDFAEMLNGYVLNPETPASMEHKLSRLATLKQMCEQAALGIKSPRGPPPRTLRPAVAGGSSRQDRKRQADAMSDDATDSSAPDGKRVLDGRHASVPPPMTDSAMHNDSQ